MIQCHTHSYGLIGELHKSLLSELLTLYTNPDKMNPISPEFESIISDIENLVKLNCLFGG